MFFRRGCCVPARTTMAEVQSFRIFALVLLLATITVLASTTPQLSAAPSLSRLPSSRNLHSNNVHRNKEVQDDGVARSFFRSLEAGKRRILPSLLSHASPSLIASTRTAAYNSQNDRMLRRGTLHVSTLKRVLKVPPIIVSKIKDCNPPKNFGQYYGLSPDKIFPYESTTRHQKETEMEKQLAISQTLSETLEEMKNMRKELQILRREMYEMRKKITGEQDLEFEEGVMEEEEDPEVIRLAQQKRQRHFERIGREVEKWARHKLFEEDRVGNGWVEVTCNKVVCKTVNANGRTKCYVNYLPDSRGKNAFTDDKREYPCLKVYSTLDAPLEDVCTYLSRKEHMTDYNYILTAQKDLEEIAPHCKITLATSPQVLFVKPREFVTFVYHRWLKDGSVVLINQACDHKDAPAVTEEGKGKACRGYALRGATFFSPDPQDRQKTRIAMIAHAASGGDLPQWAVKTAVGAIAPLEPFKLFYNINEEVHKAAPEIEKLKLERAEQVSVPGRSNQPVGFAQIGFACFWPNGGGLAPASATNAAPTMDDNKSSTMQPQLATGEDPTSLKN